MNDTLKIAEHFLSFQGEGKTIGKRAVFLRLSGCKLNCIWCDTSDVWKRGKIFKFNELEDIFIQEGYLEHMRLGAHLVLTGGDPLLQQTALGNFVNFLLRRNAVSNYVEVETEGVIQPMPVLDNIVSHYNVSPKLENSGMKKVLRFKPEVLKWHANRFQDIFKFPVADNNDAFEALELLDEAGVDVDSLKRSGRIYFMPICDTREAQDAVAAGVVDLAKNYKVNYSPRVHLQIWNRKTGV